MGISIITEEKTLSELLSNNPNDLKVLYFHIKDSAECRQMTDVILELSKSDEHKNVHFLQIDASAHLEIPEKYKVESVPTFLFYFNGAVADKLVGANAPLLSKKLNEIISRKEEGESSEQDLNTRLKKLINKAHVMLFMKGNPSGPKCGFSKQVIALLNSHNAKYETFDILEDWDVREGLKKYSNWPTYPQLYVNGELIGGLDILKELSENGELDLILKDDQA